MVKTNKANPPDKSDSEDGDDNEREDAEDGGDDGPGAAPGLRTRGHSRLGQRGVLLTGSVCFLSGRMLLSLKMILKFFPVPTCSCSSTRTFQSHSHPNPEILNRFIFAQSEASFSTSDQ